MNSAVPLIALKSVSKVYLRGKSRVVALDGIDLELPERGMTAIVGPSGSGKSSLLHIVGAMDRPSSGTVAVAGHDLNSLPEGALTPFRRDTIGFVFQSFNLVPNLSALENVMLPIEFAGVPAAQRRERALQLLGRVGLAERTSHHPGELSGGEQQRVAIARALANNPRVILADEPTGNLDSGTGQMVFRLLKEIAEERTVVVVTHASDLASTSERVINIKDGRLSATSQQKVQ